MEYILTFLEGIVSFISPCVLPLVPIYISYFAGQASKKHKAITNSLAFVIGFPIVFIILAVLANRFGMLFSISMTPCVGTFLTSALLLIATENEDIKLVKIDVD